MAKADLLKWILHHDPPLMGACPTTPAPTYNPEDEECAKYKTDYERFNAVTSEAEARDALMRRVPPLTMADVEAGMVEYLK